MSGRPALVLGLRSRLVGAVLALLVGLLTITGTWVVMRSERALEEAQRQHYLALCQQLADSLRYAVLARSAALMQPTLDSLARSPQLVAVQVLDDHDVLLAERRGEHASAAREVESVEAPVQTLGSAPGDEGGELEAFGMAADAPRVVGRVVARFNASASAVLKQRVRRDIVLAFVLVGGLGLLGVLGLASSVVRRTRALARAAAQVSANDFSARIDDPTADELGELSRDFNTMTAALRQQRSALDDAAAQLAEREALSAIGRATAVIAHELKNPLGILLGAAEVAANPQRPEESRSKAARIIADEVRRLERSLQQLLQYARPQPPQRSPVELVGLCQATVARATLGGSPAEALQVELEGAPVAVLADEHQASQIVLNLLINAAQAGAKRVLIQVSQLGPRAAIRISDDGPGIDARVREQLFRPFVTTKQRGAGLGLAGSRRMARDQGGDLRLDASPVGACFVLELPLARAPEAP